ncbi:prepilin-type N-terminal cleavage/methylation domain-containing protein [bacterium]|nr:prepilin-type N-terminal cleavage/methylation domain-containing protein [bacterium]
MKFSNKKGFTLVELLVVISLIVVFSSIMTTI